MTYQEILDTMESEGYFGGDKPTNFENGLVILRDEKNRWAFSHNGEKMVTWHYWKVELEDGNAVLFEIVNGYIVPIIVSRFIEKHNIKIIEEGYVDDEVIDDPERWKPIL